MVTFARYISIDNPRLTVFKWILTLCYCLLFSLYVVWTGGAVGHHHITNGMWFRIDFPPPVASQRRNDICSSPTKYEFWYDALGVRNFSDFHCFPECPHGTLFSHCLSRSQLVDHVAEREIAFTVLIRDNDVGRDMITAFGLDIGVFYLDYGAHVPEPDFLLHAAMPKLTQHSSKRDILTVILDCDGKFIRKYEPHASQARMRFTMQDVLDWAIGSPFDMETPKFQDPPHRNYKPNAHFDHGPVPRVIGGVVRVKFSCHNWVPAHYASDVTWDGPVCLLYFSYSDGAASGKQKMMPLYHYGQYGLRERYDLYFEFVPGGHFEFFSLRRLILVVVQFLIFYRSVEYVMIFFATNCLGQHSQLYKHAIFVKFCVFEECKGTIARMICNRLTFSQFKPFNLGITKVAVAKRVASAVKVVCAEFLEDGQGETKMSQDQRINLIKAFVDFCYGSLTSVTTEVAPSEAESNHGSRYGVPVFRSNSVQNRRTSDPLDGISVSQFVCASSSDEVIDLDDLVALCDPKRSKRLLERMFGSEEVDLFQQLFDTNGAQSDEKHDLYSEEDNTHAVRTDILMSRLTVLENEVKAKRLAKPPLVMNMAESGTDTTGLGYSGSNGVSMQVLKELKMVRPVGMPLGLRLFHFINQDRQVVCRIEAVSPQGFVAAWNNKNPVKALKAGDHVISVNGVYGDFQLMLSEMSTATNLEMQVHTIKIGGDEGDEDGIENQSVTSDESAREESDISIEEDPREDTDDTPEREHSFADSGEYKVLLRQENELRALRVTETHRLKTAESIRESCEVDMKRIQDERDEAVASMRAIIAMMVDHCDQKKFEAKVLGRDEFSGRERKLALVKAGTDPQEIASLRFFADKEDMHLWECPPQPACEDSNEGEASPQALSLVNDFSAYEASYFNKLNLLGGVGLSK